MGCLDALPIVPPGANPYDVYAAAIDRYAYSTPPSSLRPRLIFLLSLLALGVVLSVVLIALLLLDAHRRNSEEGFWLFKMARRTEGPQIVTNIKLFIPINSFVVNIVIIGMTVDMFKVFVHHGSQYRTGGWMVGITLPITLGGWILTFGGLQAYAMAPKGVQLPILKPKILNYITIGGGAVLLSIQTGGVVVTAITNRSKWAAKVALDHSLKALAMSWDGVTIPSSVADVPGLVDVNARYARAALWFSMLYGVVAGIALIIWLVNLGALALLLTVHRQISIRVKDLGRHLWDETTEDALSRCPLPRPGPPELNTGVVEVELTPTVGSHFKRAFPSRTRVRQLAQERSLGASSEEARQIVGLQRVERDLFIIAGTISTLASGGGIISLCVSILCRTPDYFLRPWIVLETLYFSASWSFAIVYPFYNVLFIHNTWVNLPPPRSHSTLPPAASSLGGRKAATPSVAAPMTSRIAVTVEKSTVIDLGGPSWKLEDEDYEELEEHGSRGRGRGFGGGGARMPGMRSETAKMY